MHIVYHPDYLEHAPQWKRNYDCVMDNVKRKGLEYLPNLGAIPKEAQVTQEIITLAAKIDKDWRDLTWRLANYVNIVNPTMNAITGAIMRKEPDFDSMDNPVLIGLRDNLDGKGNDIEQAAKQAINALQWGSRCGWLVRSHPEGATLADWNNGKKLPTAAFYDALHIADWETSFEDGEEKLTYLSLVEDYQERDGGAYVSKQRLINHRIVDDLCEYQILTDDSQSDEWFPVIVAGKQIEIIPFFHCSSQSNTWSIDSTPLTSLAEISLAIYVMNAYSNKAMILSNEAKWHVDVGELDETGDRKLNPLGFSLAGRMPYYTKGGSVNVVQPQFSPETENKVEKLFVQALRVGASYFEQKCNETATGAAIRSSSSTANMSTLGNNVEATLWNLIRFMMRYFEGTNLYVKPEDIKLALNKEYFATEMDTQKLQVFYAALLEGELPRVDWHRILKKVGAVPEDDTLEQFEQRLADTGRGLM